MSVFIIAEAGVNHNGRLETALKLVEKAAWAGADAVKFQTFRAESIVSKHAAKADYQKATTDSEESQFEMLKSLELTKQDHIELIEHCKKNKIKFLSTPFDLESIDLLNELGLDTFKIPSGEITNLPYLRKIGSLNKNMILSTGMSFMEEVKDAVNVLIRYGTDRTKISVLHCNSEYPAPFEDVNLRAILTLHETLNLPVGYSDHTMGIEAPIAAVALGAVIIEKHFTLNRHMLGPDHKASIEPHDFRRMVDAIRNIEAALGDGIKKPSPSEMKNISVARKSIIASRKISKGEAFSENNITVKRPGTGISPMMWDEVIGKTAKKNFEEDDLIMI